MQATEQQVSALIIEDNKGVRENLEEILGLYGYHTTTAADGLRGARLAIELLPDIILCDVMMPELDGFGVLNLLSENQRTAGIPFVFITAKTETVDIRRGMNLGADDYITKPFYKDELLRVIRLRLKKAAIHRAATTNHPTTVHLSDPTRGLNHLRKTFATQGLRRAYDPGTVIVREGEHPHFIYRVASGQVHLVRAHEYGRDYILAGRGAGDIFGVPSMLERTVYYYTARASTEPVICELLPTTKFMELLNTDRTVTEALMHLLAGELVNRSEHLVRQAYDSVRRRTALVLCDLYERYGDKRIDLSREELAMMVGTTKESVTRAISDFRKDKLLLTHGRAITLLAPDTLRSLLI